MNNQYSKQISYLLRHTEGYFDKYGWATVASILKDVGITKEELDEIVHFGQSDGKHRFEYDDKEENIRAVQGHSIDVDLGLQPQVPPVVLYHGTKPDALELILKHGLQPMNRQHVHLSADVKTAEKVATRRNGKNIILQIDCKAMFARGYKFYKAKNGVWLINEVPTDFISYT